MMKKKLIGVLSMVCAGFVGLGVSSMSREAKAESAKTIDVYVVAGQSNAAGCATISSVDASRKKAVYTSGFENIYFYGKVDANETLNSNGPFNTFDKVVKFGQGFDDDRFGAEIGIADAIKQSGTKNESIIVKYASGSLNITNHWCPPSKSSGENGGAWYEGCMDTVQTVVTHYADLGYTVNLKGTFWMQGEAEAESGAGSYESYLTALIGDMRGDYAEMFGEAAKNAPFVVGKVCPSYNISAATHTEAVRTAQDNVAKAVANVYTAETSRYTIDNADGSIGAGCVDHWHFNGNDMIALGIQAGNKILYPQGKSIAMYLIAGQSNASGYSLVSQISSYTSTHKGGFANVKYFGRADSNYVKNFDTVVDFGQGAASDRFGAEVGIAEKHTSAFPDQEAIIVKYAQGATYLTDSVNDVTSAHGNWLPPSIEGTQGALSGKLYKGFIEYIEKAVDYYYDCGYEIDLKGTFWMQGEAECDGTYGTYKYEECLEALINDLRADYAKIFEDDVQKQSAFVIGKISPSFNGAIHGQGAVEAVRQIQNRVAAKLSHVYLVETPDIIDQSTGKTKGPDNYHFGGSDMLDIGRNVCDAMITASKAHVRVTVEGKGEADSGEYIFLDDENAQKTIAFTATEEHQVIVSATYDGADVLSQFVNGTFTITDTDGTHELVVTFGAESKYAVETEYDKTMAKVTLNPSSKNYYAGTELKITVTAKTGYKLVSVVFNGETVTLDEKGKAKITVSAGENKLIVSAVSETAQDSSSSSSSGSSAPDSSSSSGGASTSTAKGGCSGSVSAGFACLTLLGAAFVLAKKRK